MTFKTCSRTALTLTVLSTMAFPQLLFAAAPVVSTGGVSTISDTARTLSGNITSIGDVIISNRGFEYGQTTAYGSTISGTQPLTYSTSFGSNGTGNGQFDGPTGISFNASGDIFVTDQSNSRVQRFNSAGAYQSQWGSTGNGNGEFDVPTGIMITTSTDIYVVDTGNNRIQRFNSSGAYQSQWGSAGSGNGQFNSPFGIAIDSAGYIYVADGSNNRIQKFSTTGAYQSQWGSAGSGNGQFSTPIGVAIDTDNNIYVVDNGNNRIQKFDTSGTFITSWGSAGSGNGQFNGLGYITIDTSNRIYVTDASNGRIQRFTSTGTFIDSVNTSLTTPQGIDISPSGILHVTDTNNQDVNLFTTTGSFSESISNLSCGTYYYRAFASNGDGTSYGSSQTFETYSCGGGVPLVIVTPSAPATADGGQTSLSFSVNNNLTTTTSRTVRLDLSADPKTTTGYAVSLLSSLTDASIHPYASSASFTLPETAGTHTIYLKYYSPSGHSSDTLTRTITYTPSGGMNPPNIPTPAEPATASKPQVTLSPSKFVRTLAFGMSGEDVRMLQQYLNTNGFPVAASGPGAPGKETIYFGPATRQALIRFQEAHAKQILNSVGLTRGTGIFGPSTRAFMNAQ